MVILYIMKKIIWLTLKAKNEDPAIINHDDDLKSLESAMMIAIDTIRIDEHSRLKSKKIFPMAPQDTFTRYFSNLSRQVQ